MYAPSTPTANSLLPKNRFIARDVRDYAEKAPAGLVIGSQMIGVMKNFHDITAPADGTITEFLMENEQEVDAGDELLVIDLD